MSLIVLSNLLCQGASAWVWYSKVRCCFVEPILDTERISLWENLGKAAPDLGKKCWCVWSIALVPFLGNFRVKRKFSMTAGEWKHVAVKKLWFYSRSSQSAAVGSIWTFWFLFPQAVLWYPAQRESLLNKHSQKDWTSKIFSSVFLDNDSGRRLSKGSSSP